MQDHRIIKNRLAQQLFYRNDHNFEMDMEKNLHISSLVTYFNLRINKWVHIVTYLNLIQYLLTPQSWPFQKFCIDLVTRCLFVARVLNAA